MVVSRSECSQPRPTPQRRVLPARRGGYRQKFVVGGQTVYLCTGEYEDGTLGEIFIDANKTGTVVRALLGAVAISVSRALQYGVPLTEFVSAFKEFHFEPSGVVEGDSRIKETYSILDYIFTELEMSYVKKEYPMEPTDGPIGTPQPIEIVEQDVSASDLQRRKMEHILSYLRQSGHRWAGPTVTDGSGV